MGFLRPEHAAIAEALASMDAELLSLCRCYFGGGTAIVLQNGEYRLSRDVDFMCSDVDGYRELRSLAVQKGLGGFFGRDAEPLRDFKTDQYGLRTMLRWHETAIKFEIVREARIELDGQIDAALGVPVLTLEDQFAEKLLANADRGSDRSFGYRDAIDLGYLVRSHGSIPTAAIAKVEKAYGKEIRRKIGSVITLLGERSELRQAADALGMSSEAAEAAIQALRSAAPQAWPDLFRT